MEPFIGQIMAVGFNYAPRGWAMCSGQLLPIAQYSAVFSLLGTSFGGNGTTNFGLPNLNGRMAVGTGQSAGTSNYVLGQSSGTESVTLSQSQMPAHIHAATFTGTGSTFKACSTLKATSNTPTANAVLARSTDVATTPTSAPAIYAPAGSTADMALAGLNVAGTVTVTPTGGSSPVPILSPYLALTMIIALEGIFPSRN